jgi:hypothetical protein
MTIHYAGISGLHRSSIMQFLPFLKHINVHLGPILFFFIIFLTYGFYVYISVIKHYFPHFL